MPLVFLFLAHKLRYGHFPVFSVSRLSSENFQIQKKNEKKSLFCNKNVINGMGTYTKSILICFGQFKANFYFHFLAVNCYPDLGPWHKKYKKLKVAFSDFFIESIFSPHLFLLA